MNAHNKRAVWISIGIAGCMLLSGVSIVFLNVRQDKLDHALIKAIKDEDAPRAISLVDRGANPNAAVKSGDTFSIAGQFSEWRDRLTGVRAERKHYHPTALALSFDRNLWRNGATKDEVWAALLRHGADPLTMDEYGSTLLSYAAQDHHAPTVRLLMKLHVDPNLKDGNGNQPLVYTNSECAQILVENGANPDCRGACGVTPLIAAGMNDFSAGQLLMDHQAFLNAQDQDGQTPLMLAFIHHKHDFTGARALLNHGAKVTITDKSGKTALDYARKRNARDLIARMETMAQQE